MILLDIDSEIFIKMASLLWDHVYIEHSQSVQYLAHSFTTYHLTDSHHWLRVTSSLYQKKWTRSAMKPV